MRRRRQSAAVSFNGIGLLPLNGSPSPRILMTRRGHGSDGASGQDRWRRALGAPRVLHRGHAVVPRERHLLAAGFMSNTPRYRDRRAHQAQRKRHPAFKARQGGHQRGPQCTASMSGGGLRWSHCSDRSPRCTPVSGGDTGMARKRRAGSRRISRSGSCWRRSGSATRCRRSRRATRSP